MNRPRRNKLDTLIERINLIREELECVMNDEKEYRDSIPENLQGSKKYTKSDEACDSLQEAIDQLEEVTSSIESAQE